MAGGTFFGVIDDSGLNVGDGDQKDQDEGQSRQSGHRVGKKSRHLDFLFLTLPGNFYFSIKIIWVPLPSSRSDQIILLVLFQATKGIPLSPSLSLSLSLFLSLSSLSPLSPSLSICPSPLLLPPSFSLYSLFKVLLVYSRALSLFRVTRYLFPPNSSSLTLTHTHTLSCYLRHSRSCSNAFSCSYSLSFAFSITDTHSLRTSFQGTHPLSHSFSHTLTHTHGYTLMVVSLHTHTHTHSFSILPTLFQHSPKTNFLTISWYHRPPTANFQLFPTTTEQLQQFSDPSNATLQAFRRRRRCFDVRLRRKK